MTKQSASTFVLSLNIPLWKLLGRFRRPQLWATGDWQLCYNNMPAHASCLVGSFLAKYQIIQVTQHPYKPDSVPWDFWLFPKLKSPLKGKRFQIINEIQENMKGQLMVIGRTMWGSQGAYFAGDWGVIVLCTMFLVSRIFFNKCLYFLYYVAGCFLDRPLYVYFSKKLSKLSSKEAVPFCILTSNVWVSIAPHARQYLVTILIGICCIS